MSRGAMRGGCKEWSAPGQSVRCLFAGSESGYKRRMHWISSLDPLLLMAGAAAFAAVVIGLMVTVIVLLVSRSRRHREDAHAAEERLFELARRAPDAFAEAAADPDVATLNRPLPDRLVSLVADRVKRCLAILGNKFDS